MIYSNVTTEAQSRAYRAFGFAAELLAAGVLMLTEGHGHASLRAWLGEGRQIMEFSSGRRLRLAPVRRTWTPVRKPKDRETTDSLCSGHLVKNPLQIGLL
ncbi:MAG: hypothetical protein NTX73_01805 [Rhodobacterales bacterium]|nr:hypothetical protein [Rhodobacterales bacterium]